MYYGQDKFVKECYVKNTKSAVPHKSAYKVVQNIQKYSLLGKIKYEYYYVSDEV